jgi:tetratricopeptide (TPR) repeat protein
MRAIAALVLFWVFVLTAPSPVRAQTEADPAARAEARSTTQRATRFYDHGRFEQALEGYQQAYALFPAPGLLFNIAQCHRELGQHQLAIERFEQYLRERPDAPNRALVLDLTAESRAALAQGRAREEQGRSSGSEAALTAELQRQQAALAELERAQRELEQARATGAERREGERERYEAALTELETARRELEEARERLELGGGTELPTVEVYEEAWFWTLIVSAVLVIGAGVTIGIVLTQEPGLPFGTLGTIDLR